MKIITPNYKILSKISKDGVEELKLIEYIGRGCYDSKDKITADGESAKRFVKMLINNKHEAMIEHSSLSVSFTVDRGISHELVRHRMAAFAQSSQRYCNYTKEKYPDGISFIKPFYLIEGTEGYSEWYKSCKEAEKQYIKLIEMGYKPEEARAVLPNSTATEIVITANYREWRHILNLRAAGATGKPHPQMLEIMIPLLKDLQKKIPIIFDDINSMNTDDNKDAENNICEDCKANRMKIWVSNYPKTKEEQVDCAALNHCLVCSSGKECNEYCEKYISLEDILKTNYTFKVNK